jgi:hypothetical protein
VNPHNDWPGLFEAHCCPSRTRFVQGCRGAKTPTTAEAPSELIINLIALYAASERTNSSGEPRRSQGSVESPRGVNFFLRSSAGEATTGCQSVARAGPHQPRPAEYAST